LIRAVPGAPLLHEEADENAEQEGGNVMGKTEN
jgi:hypothetical protein